HTLLVRSRPEFFLLDAEHASWALARAERSGVYPHRAAPFDHRFDHDDRTTRRRRHLVRIPPSSLLSLVVSTLLAGGTACGQAAKPNVLVILGDDIGLTNISAYSDGLMGYTTPNIDRIGNEGVRFLQYYAEQSCTAGRAAFLTGQHGIRTGLT